MFQPVTQAYDEKRVADTIHLYEYPRPGMCSRYKKMKCTVQVLLVTVNNQHLIVKYPHGKTTIPYPTVASKSAITRKNFYRNDHLY